MHANTPVASRRAARRGSALITTVVFVAVLALLTASMLKYSSSEQRGNERNRLNLRAKNMAENITVYTAEQLTTKLNRLGIAPDGVHFPWTGTSRNRVDLPPASILNTNFTSAATGMETRAGILFASPYATVTDTTDANCGLFVSTAVVPIIAKATATHPSLGSVSAYVEQNMSLTLTPLFQFGVFYNMDLELFPGQNMELIGPVHTNGRLLARGEVGGSATLSFRGRVTVTEGLYANGQKKANYVKRPGSVSSGAGGTGAVNFAASNGTLKNLYGSSIWRDQEYGAGTESETTKEQFKIFAINTYTGNLRTQVHNVTRYRLPSVKPYNEQNLGGTPEDERNNGRQIIEPPNPRKWSLPGHSNTWSEETDDAKLRSSKVSWRAGLYIVANPDDDVRTVTLPDETTANVLPRSYRCWLNTINSNGSHTLAEVILPGQPCYGYDNNGTALNDTDDFAYVNNLPNRYTTATAVGYNQVLRLPQTGYARVKRHDGSAWVPTDSTTLPNGAGYSTTWPGGSFTNGFPAENSTTPYPADAFFYDLRRADGNQGYSSAIAGGSARSTANYLPRPIAKIDLDMTRFKMMVDRTLSGSPNSYAATATTSTVYDVGAPNASNWSASIFNPGGAAAATKLGLGSTFSDLPGSSTPAAPDPFRMYFAPSNPIDANVTADPGLYALGGASLKSSSAASPWYDGVAVYIHSVDAEVRHQTAGVPDRVDSGVRLLNGRGPIVSLTDANMTGCTVVTNDAAYIIGHYNANGSVNATASATGDGGYSAVWPDSADEKLCSVMADAITLLSQPTYSTASSPYYQVGGWNDALSAFRVTSSSWSSNWRTNAPSSSNQYEGLGTSATAIRPGALPNSSTPGTGGGTWRSKLPTVNTEFSTALLMGLVPSNHDATQLTDHPPIAAANAGYSGGAHNFPRLLEDWHNDMGDGSTKGLFIRGSMVALFESRVAMEPYNLRCYQAPTRYWGLHNGFTSPHDLPLEPILLSSIRVGFRELSSSEYATMKATIEALTALP